MIINEVSRQIFDDIKTKYKVEGKNKEYVGIDNVYKHPKLTKHEEIIKNSIIDKKNLQDDPNFARIENNENNKVHKIRTKTSKFAKELINVVSLDGIKEIIKFINVINKNSNETLENEPREIVIGKYGDLEEFTLQEFAINKLKIDDKQFRSLNSGLNYMYTKINNLVKVGKNTLLADDVFDNNEFNYGNIPRLIKTKELINQCCIHNIKLEIKITAQHLVFKFDNTKIV